jgi:hypothetical protein
MASIISLPTELLLDIFRYLYPADEANAQAGDCRASHRALGALARSCRIINPAATQVLYERYEADFAKPIVPFLYHSLLCPSSKSGVKHIAVEGQSYEPSAEAPEHETGLQLRRGLSDDIARIVREKGLPSYVLAMLVVQSHNIEIFEMRAQDRMHMRGYFQIQLPF